MSYYINFTASSKEEAKARAAAEFDTVVASQPPHAKDRPQALAAAGAFIDLLADDTTNDIQVTLAGSVSFQGAYDNTNPDLTAANVSVNAFYVARAAAPAPADATDADVGDAAEAEDRAAEDGDGAGEAARATEG